MNKLSEFFDYLKLEKRYSLNTVNAYKRDLKMFDNYLKQESISEIDELTIKNYLAFLYVRKLTKKTISRKISSIKSYYKFLNKKSFGVLYFLFKNL